MARSAIYFPLRSNAASLVAGRGVASVRRRILVVALGADELEVFAIHDDGQLWNATGLASRCTIGRRWAAS